MIDYTDGVVHQFAGASQGWIISTITDRNFGKAAAGASFAVGYAIV